MLAVGEAFSVVSALVRSLLMLRSRDATWIFSTGVNTGSRSSRYCLADTLSPGIGASLRKRT